MHGRQCSIFVMQDIRSTDVDFALLLKIKY